MVSKPLHPLAEKYEEVLNEITSLPQNLIPRIITLPDGKRLNYDCTLQKEDDVKKYYHYLYDMGTEDPNSAIRLDFNWSSYSVPSDEDIILWYELGQPNRSGINRHWLDRYKAHKEKIKEILNVHGVDINI